MDNDSAEKYFNTMCTQPPENYDDLESDNSLLSFKLLNKPPPTVEYNTEYDDSDDSTVGSIECNRSLNSNKNPIVNPCPSKLIARQ